MQCLQIDSNLDALGGAASRLNGLARATGQEVEDQNRLLERVNQKVYSYWQNFLSTILINAIEYGSR